MRSVPPTAIFLLLKVFADSCVVCYPSLDHFSANGLQQKGEKTELKTHFTYFIRSEQDPVPPGRAILKHDGVCCRSLSHSALFSCFVSITSSW